MAERDPGNESRWRLSRQTMAAADLAGDLRAMLAELDDPPPSWREAHLDVAGRLASELQAHTEALDATAVDAAAVEDLQRRAIADSATVSTAAAGANADVASARELLLQGAVLSETAEEVEDRLSHRLFEIRRLTS